MVSTRPFHQLLGPPVHASVKIIWPGALSVLILSKGKDVSHLHVLVWKVVVCHAPLPEPFL